MLIVYGLIGRYTMADLQEDRSLVRNLLKLGVDLYVVDWGNPSRADRWLTLDDYIDGYLAECVRVISERHGIDKVSLLGICEGGVFTTCYAALHPDTVKSMVLTITPIDFHGDTVENRLGHGFINIWTRSLTPEDIDRLIEAYGNLPGEFMGSVFSQMTPMRTLMKYNLDLLEVMDDDKKFLNFLRMEKWIADRPHHPGEAAKQWLKDLYQDNKLINNAFTINGRQVDLGNITMPVLNVFAKDDHIIPARHLSGAWAQGWAPRTTPSCRCRADTSASSSAASRRLCSAPGSPSGWPRGLEPMTLKNKIVSADEAIAIVRDGDTMCVSGFVGIGTPDELILALERRFLKERHPIRPHADVCGRAGRRQGARPQSSGAQGPDQARRGRTLELGAEARRARAEQRDRGLQSAARRAFRISTARLRRADQGRSRRWACAPSSIRASKAASSTA